MTDHLTVSSAQETCDAIVAAYRSAGRSIERPERWLLARVEELRAAGYTWARIVAKLSPDR